MRNKKKDLEEFGQHDKEEQIPELTGPGKTEVYRKSSP
jgi:hypothetical protein